MGKRILRVYLAKNDTPYSAAYAKLELPASPWEVWDAMEKVRLQTDDILYMEIEDYFAFEYLSPHLDGLDISLNELNDLAAQLAALDEVQGIAFEGMFSIAVSYTHLDVYKRQLFHGELRCRQAGFRHTLRAYPKGTAFQPGAAD